MYGASKVACEDLVRNYTDTYEKVKGYNLRLCATVGPNTTHGLLHDLKAKLRNMHNEELELIGDAPGSCKPFIHMDDVVSAFKHFLLEDLDPGQYNITTTDPVTVEEFANIAMDTMGIHKPIKWLGWGANWKGDDTHVKFNNTSTAFRAKWQAAHTSKEAIAKACQK